MGYPNSNITLVCIMNGSR